MKKFLNLAKKRICPILIALMIMIVPILGACDFFDTIFGRDRDSGECKDDCTCVECVVEDNCPSGCDCEDCDPPTVGCPTDCTCPECITDIECPSDCTCEDCKEPTTECPTDCDCPECKEPIDECPADCDCVVCDPPPVLPEGIQLSHSAGFFNSAFDLQVSVPKHPNATIFYTLDGTEPGPSNVLTTRGASNNIVVSGSVANGETVRVEDRTRHKNDTVLTRYYSQWSRKSNQGPANDAQILMGSAFRFRAFEGNTPVSDTVKATYIVTPGATTRFANTPIVSINADYEAFKTVYSLTDRWNPPPNNIGRQVFNFEYFTVDGSSYRQRFNVEGSTSLGGSWTRDNAQRTLNVHLQRGSLNNSITYPIFDGLDEFHRFRLWNGGNNFVGPRDWGMGNDHFRDAFAQKASAGLNVLHADSRVAIKFVNGEFWGFTQFREHTSNAAFVSARTGMAANNIAIMDRGARNPALNGGLTWYFDEVEEGNETTVTNLYNNLISFITAPGFFPSEPYGPSDSVVEELFRDYFCKDNFMDYIIANTFWNNTDWPQNNVRFFRAITPNVSNQFNDGRWRFILHDMDQTANGVWPNQGGANDAGGSRFSALLNPTLQPEGGGGPAFNRVFRVLANQNFVNEFTLRAQYLMLNDFAPSVTAPLHQEFMDRFTPLLPDMYTRWGVNSGSSATSNITTATNHFNRSTTNVRFFANNREAVYLGQLNGLRTSVGLAPL